MKRYRANASSRKQPAGLKWSSLALVTLLMLPFAGFATPPGTVSPLKFGARAGSMAFPPQGGLLYFVDSTGDGGHVGSSNFCDDGTGKCTLRAAIQAANLHPGDDGIQFNIPTTDPGYNSAAGSWTINLTRALPDLSTSVAIVGPGADKLTVRRDSGGDYSIFRVTLPAPGEVTTIRKK